MAHLGRNLLPTWPILRPSWAHLRPNFAQNLHQIAPEISRSVPRDPKTTHLGLEFSWFRGRFWISFFSAVSPSILHGLPASSSRHVAAWRAQRIGYIRRPAERWSGVCKPRRPACPISNFQPYLMVPGGPPRALKCPRQPA